MVAWVPVDSVDQAPLAGQEDQWAGLAGLWAPVVCGDPVCQWVKVVQWGQGDRQALGARWDLVVQWGQAARWVPEVPGVPGVQEAQLVLVVPWG